MKRTITLLLDDCGFYPDDVIDGVVFDLASALTQQINRDDAAFVASFQIGTPVPFRSVQSEGGFIEPSSAELRTWPKNDPFLRIKEVVEHPKCEAHGVEACEVCDATNCDHVWVEGVDENNQLIEPAFDVCSSCGEVRQ